MIARSPQRVLDRVADLAQAIIAGLMPVTVIVALEEIHIDHHQPQWLFVALRPAEFLLQQFVKPAAVI